MGQSQKPRRKYRPKDVRTPMLVGTDLVLRPLERIIEQICIDGTTNVSRRGTPMFQNGSSEWFDTAEAIDGVILHLEMYSLRTGIAVPLDALRELHIAFKYAVPIFERTLDGVTAAMPVLRRIMSAADPDVMLDILRQTQIKIELDKKAERERIAA